MRFCDIPPLYGVGAGVAMGRGYWPPPLLPLIPCPEPEPQRPPQQPPQQQPSQQPQPNPPPPQSYVGTYYHLGFPLLVGANVRVVWNAYLGTRIFPSTDTIALQFQYYPNTSARPRIFATTTNPFIDTFLRQYIDDRGSVYVVVDPPPIGYSMDIIQLLYYNQSWIVACYEVNFPNVTLLYDGNAAPDDLRFILQNREEKLKEFYDTEFVGFGSFTCNNNHLIIHLAPAEAYIQPAYLSFPNIYIRPFSNNAYCMLIDPLRGG
jgi:hypothetical protein